MQRAPRGEVVRSGSRRHEEEAFAACCISEPVVERDDGYGARILVGQDPRCSELERVRGAKGMNPEQAPRCVADQRSRIHLVPVLAYR